ncbi:ECF transporter S component [Eubacterium limosum]|uniref:ECF transporter S component n=1 Tax=Eubacterium limosum TaxID=1736 RepID=A0ABT5UTH3_EUBLI|nr:ECF transporter S component [Eubacterium limosum]MCB6570991.1 ECF transporter S component [Eubacterium limosum]MDE1472259.1 ECF transporter S component [Eubacterium limosum]
MLSNESLDHFLDDFLDGKKSNEKLIMHKRENAVPVQTNCELWTPPDDGAFIAISEKKKLSKRTLVSTLMILVLIPLTIFIGMWIGDRKYLFISMAIIIYTMIPFVMVFEGRKPQARELIILAVLAAIAVAGRVAFFMLPQFKPVIAIVIIAGICFGAESGFLVGAISMFVSNFFSSQGPWTPWQMFAAGIIGFLAGILFQKGRLNMKKLPLCVFGFFSTFFIYGFLLDTASVFMFQSEVTFKSALPLYFSGAPFNLIHACSTVFFLFIGARPLVEKLERIKVKYGLIKN